MAIPDEVMKLVKESGNAFHSRVARWFQGAGWNITISPYYMDQALNKAREIDLIAEKVCYERGSQKFGHISVVVRRFVECKFVPAASVFWFSDKDTEAAENLVCPLAGSRIDNRRMIEHHYLSGSHKVAKVFASSTSKESENEPFYKALNQVLNAQVALRGKSSIDAKLRTRGEQRIVNIEFPVVVCSAFDKMYAVDFLLDVEPVVIRDNFQLEVRYAYADTGGNHRKDYFLIDFVKYEALGAFTESLKLSAEVAAHNLTSR